MLGVGLLLGVGVVLIRLVAGAGRPVLPAARREAEVERMLARAEALTRRLEKEGVAGFLAREEKDEEGRMAA